MEILFLHQPSCGRFGFCYRLLLLTSPLYAKREAVHFRAAQAPRSNRPRFFRAFDGMPHLGSAVGRYDLSLVGTENHWPARDFRSHVRRVPNCGVYNARHGYGSASSHFEPFYGWCHAFHLSSRWRHDERCVLPRDLVPGSPGPVCHAGWCTYDTDGPVTRSLRYHHSGGHPKDRILCSCYAPFAHPRIDR